MHPAEGDAAGGSMARDDLVQGLVSQAPGSLLWGCTGLLMGRGPCPPLHYSGSASAGPEPRHSLRCPSVMALQSLFYWRSPLAPKPGVHTEPALPHFPLLGALEKPSYPHLGSPGWRPLRSLPSDRLGQPRLEALEYESGPACG